MNTILLRYRELTQGIITVDEHNKVCDKEGSALWGWWKKAKEVFPDPTLPEIAAEIVNSQNVFVYFVNSDTCNFYKAPLKKVHYKAGGKYIQAPNPDLCPNYYNRKDAPAWFEIGKIEPVLADELKDFVLSEENRTTRHHDSIPREAIGQHILDIAFLEHPVSMWFLCPSSKIDFLGMHSVPNVSKGSYDTKGKYILHLSDLHFGINHAYRNPLAGEEPISKAMLIDELVEDIKNYKKDIYDNIGLILITGDLTWSANPHEFSNAVQFIKQLKEEFGLGNQHIIVVPGNHDIEWLDKDGVIDHNAELNYRNFYREVYNVKPNDELLKIGRFNIGGENVCIIAMNSCRLESKENAGYGYVGNDQLRKIQTYFSDKSEIDYIIALLHHHVLPVNYIEEYDPKSKRVSMLLDAESVVRTLISCEVCTTLHGHQHQPYYSKLKRFVPGYIRDGHKTNLDGEICIIGGGSLGVNQQKVNMIGRNTYNILYRENGELQIITRIKSGNGMGFYSENDDIPIVIK